jgi:hypothetical protein
MVARYWVWVLGGRNVQKDATKGNEGAGCLSTKQKQHSTLTHVNRFAPPCLSVLQYGPRVNLGCRSSEFLDHAKT